MDLLPDGDDDNRRRIWGDIAWPKCWLEQRLKNKTKKEIEMMLLGELPDLEETASGNDLVRIGEKVASGAAKNAGWRRQSWISLSRGTDRFQGDRGEVRQTHSGRSGATMQFLAQCQSLEEVAQWLAGPKPRAEAEQDLAKPGVRLADGRAGAACLLSALHPVLFSGRDGNQGGSFSKCPLGTERRPNCEIRGLADHWGRGVPGHALEGGKIARLVEDVLAAVVRQ